MNLKLDENPGRSAAEYLRAWGHDVATVPDESLSSAPDRTLIQVCQSEGRCLITLDVEFGNPLLFKPSEHHGMAVLRLPSRASPEILREALQTLAAGLAQNPIDGLLWIIQRGRIREYQEEGRKDF